MKAIMYEGPRELKVIEVPQLPMNEEQIRIKSIYSGVSHGTEMNVYRGLAPFFRKKQDPATRLFVPAAESEVWEYPVRSCAPGVWYMGYASVGEVIETGSKVENVKVGDIVACSAPHQEENVIAAKDAVVLPKSIPAEKGVLFTNLITAYNGIMDTHINLGDTVVVSGLGVIGQLLVQMAKMSGAHKVYGVDVLEKRRKAALENGCDEVFDPTACDVAMEVRKRTSNRGADKVIEASGNARALNEAVRIAAPETTITALAWYQGALSNVDLSEEFHHNRIGIKQSQTGAMDPAFSNLWNYQRRVETCLTLLEKLKTDNLFTEFQYDDIRTAYYTIDKEPEKIIQAVITY
ncbi:zinc-binding dehydrogenase [Parablautia intestinalis]|uniref:zinc-binding dehydrogenase n=1 Tax=Parablautia intestinalis TaxID=2320100 RepID=UPI00256F10BD|nr:zinc-binding dehydrogenase [Parablautia intestinalis]